ncbi:MAG: HDOD domain-containing protein [Hydrogenimonas sp.]|nr:HDOD domain-containing protein [Hydrogenimonas sp.]
MVEKVLRKIKSLPPLPESVNRVRQICDDPNGTIKELVPIVKEDPMFTADILKAANSPLYGFSRQITSIDQAVALFGMGTIQGFAISYAIRESFPINLSPYGVSQSQLLKVSALQNSLTLHWGKKQVATHKAEMMTTSLLMELGKVVSSAVLEEEGKSGSFGKEIKNAKTAEEIAKVEKRFLDITSEWIAALMFKQWKFHDAMVSMLRFIERPEEAPENIRRHVEILSVVKEATPLLRPLSEESLQSAYEKADSYGLEAETLHEAIEKISK